MNDNPSDANKLRNALLKKQLHELIKKQSKCNAPHWFEYRSPVGNHLTRLVLKKKSTDWSSLQRHYHWLNPDGSYLDFLAWGKAKGYFRMMTAAEFAASLKEAK